MTADSSPAPARGAAPLDFSPARGTAPLDFSPAPGAAPMTKMIRAQAVAEARALLRNGEQLGLMLVIPMVLLIGLSVESVVNLNAGMSRVDFTTPGVLALAVMSTAFTGQAIGTGFERRYGVLKRLGAEPLSRAGLIAAKTCTVVGVEMLQAALICVAGAILGWSPDASPAAVITVPLLLLLGTAAFSGLGLAMAGSLRAEGTLALANIAYVLLLVTGGIMYPLSKLGSGASRFLELLPTGALSTGLRSVLAHHAVFPLGNAFTLAVWAVAGIALAVRVFKWE